MRLIDFVKDRQKEAQRRLVFPMGIFPAITWLNGSFSENYFDAKTQVETIKIAVERVPMDFVRTITDMTTEAEAMGSEVIYHQDAPPIIKKPLLIELDKVQLGADPDRDGRLPLQLEVLRQTKSWLKIKYPPKQLLGSCNGPFTILGQLLGSSQAVLKTITDAQSIHTLLEQITEFLISYARSIMAAGADILWISEPLASVLSPQQYWVFSGQYLQKIFQAVTGMTILHICGDTTNILQEMEATGAQGLSLDEKVSLTAAANKVSQNVVLIGNISPTKIMDAGTMQEVTSAAKSLLYAMLPYENFILSTGCSLPATVTQENMLALAHSVERITTYNYPLTDELEAIRKAVMEGDKECITRVVNSVLQAGVKPEHVLHGCLMPAMNDLGDLYQQNEVFIPELLLASEVMYRALDIIRPYIVGESAEPKGVIVIGTVENDLHDIGKNLVGMMLESQFYQIIDLGKNVSAESFLNTALEANADCIALSAMTTTTMLSMQKIIAQLRQDSRLNNCKILVGGAPVTKEFAQKIGADGYADDATEAVKTITNLLQGA